MDLDKFTSFNSCSPQNSLKKGPLQLLHSGKQTEAEKILSLGQDNAASRRHEGVYSPAAPVPQLPWQD